MGQVTHPVRAFLRAEYLVVLKEAQQTSWTKAAGLFSVSGVERSSGIDPSHVAREGKAGLCDMSLMRRERWELSAEQAVVLVFDYLVAFADRRFEAVPVEDLDAAAHVADEPLFL